MACCAWTLDGHLLFSTLKTLPGLEVQLRGGALEALGSSPALGAGTWPTVLGTFAGLEVTTSALSTCRSGCCVVEHLGNDVLCVVFL